MKMLIQLSWKNLWRHPVRSLVIMSSIALGLIGCLFSLGFVKGMQSQMIDSAIHLYISHIQIHHPNFGDDMGIGYRINESETFRKALAQTPGIQSFTERLVVTGMASSARTAEGVLIQGIDGEAESRVSRIHQCLTSGQYLKGVKKNPVLIGSKLAERLGVRLKSKIVLTFQDAEGIITAGAFRVAGIFHTEYTDFNRGQVFVKKADLRKITNIASGHHEAALLLEDHTQVDRVKQELQQQFPELKVEAWYDLAPELKSMSDLNDKFMAIFFSIILVAMTMGVVNTMLMVILERGKETGMLMAIGMAPKNVFILLLLESCALSFCGAFAGLLGGVGTISYFKHNGLDLGQFAEGLSTFGIQEIIYPELPITAYIYLTLTVFIAAILAAVYPGIKAVTTNPLTALRRI